MMLHRPSEQVTGKPKIRPFGTPQEPSDATPIDTQSFSRVPCNQSRVWWVMATTAELTLPWLLWFGFGARFAALALLGMTAVIQFFVYPGAYVTHGLWAVALLMIIRSGPGPLSIGHIIRRRAEARGLLREG